MRGVRRWALPLLVVFLIFASIIPAYANELNNNVSYSPPEGFTLITLNTLGDNEDFLKSIGYTKASAKKFFQDNNLILFAANADNTKQIQLKSASTDFTAEIGDLSDLNEEGINKVAAGIIDGSASKWKIVMINGMKMIETRSTAKDGGGNYCILQYTTIRNGELFALSYYCTATGFTDTIVEEGWTAAGALSIKRTDIVADGGKMGDTVMLIILSVVVLAAAAVVVVICLSFIKEIIQRSEEKPETMKIHRKK